MTTTIKVSAHCSEDTEVRIVIEDNYDGRQVFILNNGEEWQGYIYGDLCCAIGEFKKET